MTDRPSLATIHAAQAALVDLLGRHVLGQEVDDDRHRAGELLEVMGPHDIEQLEFAAAVGAVNAAWRDGDGWDPAARATALYAARALPSRSAPAHQTVLGALAVCLMALARFSPTPSVDLVRGAEILRTADQHDLCGWAARAALRRFSLSPSERARALILIAVVDHDFPAGEEAAAIAVTLPPADPGRRRVEALWPLVESIQSLRSKPRETLDAQDRASAAHRLAEAVAELRTPQADDRYLQGLHRTALGLAGEEIDVAEVRGGMGMVIQHWRDRRRTGLVPAVARAGIESVVDLLKRDLTGPSPQLLFEILEALADHGMSGFDGAYFRSGDGEAFPGALVQARASAEAAGEVTWPDLRWIVTRLGGTNVLLTHTQRRFSDGRLEVTALQLRPPIHPAINQMSLDATDQATLDLLVAQRLESIEHISSDSLVALLRTIAPPPLFNALQSDTPPSVTVVPDGPLWAVPWQAMSPFSPVVVAPSMTVSAALSPPEGPVRRIFALVDGGIPGATQVVDALETLQAAGIDVTSGRSKADLADAADHDLLLVFAHGSGQGLEYRLALPEGKVSALDLASARPPARALVASCWSARLPPTSFPLSLPNTLLLAGSRLVCGGLWPLPSVSTAEIVADALLRVGSGSGLASALHAARSTARSEEVVDRFGLGMFGKPDA